MSDEQEWAKIRNAKPSVFESASSGALRVALLFGGLAIAMGLFVAPLLDRSSKDGALAQYDYGVDPMTTAGTNRAKSETYILRRSVLNKNPTSRCVIRQNGQAFGDC